MVGRHTGRPKEWWIRHSRKDTSGSIDIKVFARKHHPPNYGATIARALRCSWMPREYPTQTIFDSWSDLSMQGCSDRHQDECVKQSRSKGEKNTSTLQMQETEISCQECQNDRRIATRSMR